MHINSVGRAFSRDNIDLIGELILSRELTEEVNKRYSDNILMIIRRQI